MVGQILGIGPTPELNLRVSVATLSRVVFPRPGDGVPMLALEHKATLKSKSQVIVKAQPFGGAIRILDLNRFQQIVGNFNFDSERSQSEQDFRVYLNSTSWERVREFCLEQMRQGTDPVLELNPNRELVEEFEDTLGFHLKEDQYALKPIGVVLENKPAPTANVRASGYPTVRIYRIDEVQIQDRDLCELMITNSEKYPPRVLKSLAQEDAHMGGRGRANAMLAAPVENIRAAMLTTPPEERGEALSFEGTLLDGNVAVLFNDIPVQKYSHLGN